MAAAFETLQVVIEADSQGIESVLRRTGQTVSRFVSDMNQKQIDWGSILSKSITPAILGSIAAAFAKSISDMISFQNAVVTGSRESSQEFQESSRDFSDSAIRVSNAVGKNKTTIAQAMALASRYFGDNIEQIEEVVSASAALGKSDEEIIQLTELFSKALRNWGITSLEDTRKALKDLYVSAKNAGPLGFTEFLQMIGDSGEELRVAGLNINDTSKELSAFASQSGLSASQVKEAFNLITSNANDALSPLNILTGMGKKLREDGLAAAIKDVADWAKSIPVDLIGEFSRQIGASPSLLMNLRNTSDEVWEHISQKIQKLTEESNKLNDSLSKDIVKNYSVSENISAVLTRITNFITEMIKNLFETVKNFVKDIFGSDIMEKFQNTYGNFLSGILKTLLPKNLENSALDYLGLANKNTNVGNTTNYTTINNFSPSNPPQGKDVNYNYPGMNMTPYR